MYQHLPLQKPPKFTQIGIFVLKINYLATLTIRLSSSYVENTFAYVDFKLLRLLEEW
jgi:hypothetical protein